VVLSRVTSLDGLFLIQPIKENYNPQPSKLLRDEWKNQREKEINLLLFLQKSRNFPEDVNVHDVALKLNHGNAQNDNFNTSLTYSNTPRTRISRKYTSFSPTIISRNTLTTSKFDSWFLEHHMRIERHLSKKMVIVFLSAFHVLLMIGGVNPLNYSLNQLLGLRIKFHKVHLGECQCG